VKDGVDGPTAEDDGCSFELFTSNEKPADHVEETSTTPKAFSRPNMTDIQRDRMMKLKNIVSFNKIKNNQSVRDMEDEPAFVRKNVEFKTVQGANESTLSKFKLTDNYKGQPELRENNSFLHDNVD
jgi:cell division protein FtsZ